VSNEASRWRGPQKRERGGGGKDGKWARLQAENKNWGRWEKQEFVKAHPLMEKLSRRRRSRCMPMRAPGSRKIGRFASAI